MKRKHIFLIAKRFISVTLIFTLLSNTASASFANVLNTGYNNDEFVSEIRNGISKDFVNTLQNSITANTITDKVNNLYYDVMALYLTDSELKAYGLTKEQLKNSIQLKEEAKQLWAKGGIEGENAVLFLGYIIPSLSLAEGKRDLDFDAYFIKEYQNYLSNKATYINDHIKKIDKELDKKDDNAKELIGLRDIILGYAMVSGYPQDEKSVRTIALNSAITNLSPYIVETYVMVLLESGLYAELTEYIKLLSYFEAIKTDTNYENMFSAVMAAYMPSTYIKQTWNNESRYAPGPVSQKGYALKEDGTLYNIWEELPAIIAGYGNDGAKVLNDIFHNGLEFYSTKQANILLPEVHWKYGALIPFIIGSIGTNKIKRGNKIEMPERYNSLVKYFGANDVGLAEISLLNHKFYDIVDYNYYKRVQNVIAEPYIKEIEADKKGTQAHYDYVTKEQKRRNFDIYRTTSWNLNNGNPYNGTLYNEANKTGLLLRKNQQTWENGKQLLHAQLNFAMVSDIVMFVIYGLSIYNSLGGLVENVQQNINILKMARSLRAGGEKSGLLKVMRGLKRDPSSYYSRLAALTKEAESAKTVKSVTTINNGATGTITWEEATGGVSDSKGIQYIQRGNNWIVAQEETATAAKTNESTEAISAMSKFRQKGIANFNTKTSRNNRYHARRELNNINKADRARRAAELNDFNNKNWLEKKWSILTGNYTHPLSTFSKFDTKLFKFANNFKITRYLVTHPLQTITAFSPLNASTVSVAHTPIINGGRAPVEIVYQFRTPTQNIPSIFEFAGNKQLAASSISKASALPKPLNVAKTLPQVKADVLGELPSIMRSPVFISRNTLPIGFMLRSGAVLSGPENYIWNYPFVALRKAEDAASGIKADDGEKLFGPGVEQTAIVSAEAEKAALAPQVSEEISKQVNRSLVPEFTSPLTINKDKQIRNFVGLAAASVAGFMMLGINPITTVGVTGMLLATAPLAMPGGIDDNTEFNLKDLRYKIFPPKTNASKLKYIREHLPQLAYHQVFADNGTTVNIADNYGFIAELEYKNFYDANFEGDEAKERLSRKVAHDNMLANLILTTTETPTEKQLQWILASAANNEYKILAAQLWKDLAYNNLADKDLADYFLKIFNLEKISLPQLSKQDIERLTDLTKRIIEESESLLDVAGGEDPILSGLMTDMDILKEEMSNRAMDALYNASDLYKDVIKPLIITKRNSYSTTYTNILPIYLRHSDGKLSSEPKIFIVLSQEVTVPDGFVVAQDENAVYKFVVSDMLAINKSNSMSRNPYKNPKRMYNLSPKDKHLLIETALSSEDKAYIALSVEKADLTPTNQDDLIALINALEKDRLDWALSAISLVAGADLAASLSSQFRKLIPIYGLMLAVAGFGYFSPKIANWFKNYINKWGNVKTAEIGLYAMLGASALGITAGMYGVYNPANAGIYGIAASVIFFTVAATVASIFNTIKGPMLKNVYTDDTIFSSKNMNFDTIKALAKVIVAGIPAMFGIPEIINNIVNKGVEGSSQASSWISQLPSINWSIMVPVTALISFWGLYSIHHSRLKAETKSNIKEEAAPQETMTPEQQAEAAKLAAEEKQAIENKFKNIIKPLLKPEYRRLYMIYLPYGIVQSIIIGQIAGLTLDTAALFVTLTGSLVSWLVRKGSTKLIKNGKITEDQLTGFMLPLMAISYIGLFLSPFDLSMTANSIPLLLSILGAYISTPALGTVENTRMLNKTVDYYNNLRVQIEENPNLTPEEKKTQIAKLNKELASMKTRTSTHYNNGNASALWPVIGLAAVAVVFLGLGNDAEHIPAFSQKYLPMIAEYLGGVKAEGIDAITKLSFFKIFLSIAAGLATATFVSNMSLTKSVFLSNKIKISQEMINNNEITVEALKLDETNMQQNVVDIVKDIESLSKDLKLRRLSLSSEAQVNDWLQKAIYINNRVRYLQLNSPDSYNQLGKSIEMFTKEALPNLKIIVEQVAVSNNKYALPRKKQVSQYSQNFMVQYDNLMESKCKKYIEQGVLPTVNTLHFERALIIRNGLIDLTEKKAAGDVYEGMEEDFEGLYESALNEISLYEKKNKFNYSEPRVTTFKKQLNSIREIFFADK